MKVISLKNCTVKITDGTAVTPKEVELELDGGVLTFTETQSFVYKKDRGNIVAVLDDDESPMEVSFNLVWGKVISAGSEYTARDIIRNDSGTFESVDDPCEAYAVNISIEPSTEFTTATGCSLAERIILPGFSHTSLVYDAKERSISASGQCSTSKAQFEEIV